MTDISGCRETVERGHNGLLVPLGDVQSPAEAILAILADRDLALRQSSGQALRMGREGRRLALERFDERLVFEKIKAEYARLLQEKGLPSPRPPAEKFASKG